MWNDLSSSLTSRSSRIVAALSRIAACSTLHRMVSETIIWSVEVRPVASTVALLLAFELIHVGVAPPAPAASSSLRRHPRRNVKALALSGIHAKNGSIGETTYQGRLTVDKICISSTYKTVPNFCEPVTVNPEKLMGCVIDPQH